MLWTIHTFSQIELRGPHDNGTLFYTLDASDPGISASLYSDPFVLRKSATLRAIAYNADFTQSGQSDPVEIIIFPMMIAAPRAAAVWQWTRRLGSA